MNFFSQQELIWARFCSFTVWGSEYSVHSTDILALFSHYCIFKFFTHQLYQIPFSDTVLIIFQLSTTLLVVRFSIKISKGITIYPWILFSKRGFLIYFICHLSQPVTAPSGAPSSIVHCLAYPHNKTKPSFCLANICRCLLVLLILAVLIFPGLESTKVPIWGNGICFSSAQTFSRCKWQQILTSIFWLLTHYKMTQNIHHIRDYRRSSLNRQAVFLLLFTAYKLSKL